MLITSPKTKLDFERYFHLRWRLLRAPWGEEEGTEKDDSEGDSFHVMAVDKEQIIAVARLQNIKNSVGQIRYMAVDNDFQKQGVGRKIVQHIEQYALNHGIKEIILHAREPAVGFYEKLGYINIEKSYLLFDSIQHYKMTKRL